MFGKVENGFGRHSFSGMDLRLNSNGVNGTPKMVKSSSMKFINGETIDHPLAKSSNNNSFSSAKGISVVRNPGHNKVCSVKVKYLNAGRI